MLSRKLLFSNVLINGAGASTSAGVYIGEDVVRVESLQLQVTSVAGTADVKAEYATSWDNVTYDSIADTTDITSSTLLDKANNPEGVNVFPVSAPLNRYIKITITGVAANPADTLVTAYLILREGYA